MKAYMEGVDAFHHGVSREANPYTIGSEREDWFDGWDWAHDQAQKVGKE